MRALCLCMIELLLVCFIGGEIRLNASHDLSRLDLLKTRQVQITIGNLEMRYDIIKL